MQNPRVNTVNFSPASSGHSVVPPAILSIAAPDAQNQIPNNGYQQHQVTMASPKDYLNFGGLRTANTLGVDLYNAASTELQPTRRSARQAQKNYAQGPDHGRKVAEPLRYPISFQQQPRFTTPGTVDLTAVPETAPASLPTVRKRIDTLVSNPMSLITTALTDLTAKVELIVQRLVAADSTTGTHSALTEDELEVISTPQLQLAASALKDVPAKHGDARAIRQPNSALICNEHQAFTIEGLHQKR